MYSSLFTLRSSLFTIQNQCFQRKDKRKEIKEKVALLRKALITYENYDIIIFEVILLNSPLLDKSLEFATQIVLFYEKFSKTKKDTTIDKQLLRSATSVGANIHEAIYGNSKADFISKLHISLKEVSESIYWLKLLNNTRLYEYEYITAIGLAEEIKRMLISSINTAKSNSQ